MAKPKTPKKPAPKTPKAPVTPKASYRLRLPGKK